MKIKSCYFSLDALNDLARLNSPMIVTIKHDLMHRCIVDVSMASSSSCSKYSPCSKSADPIFSNVNLTGCAADVGFGSLKELLSICNPNTWKVVFENGRVSVSVNSITGTKDRSHNQLVGFLLVRTEETATESEKVTAYIENLFEIKEAISKKVPVA